MRLRGSDISSESGIGYERNGRVRDRLLKVLRKLVLLIPLCGAGFLESCIYKIEKT